MRMYWGKKIPEWSNTPEYACATTLYLNNKYFVDGRESQLIRRRLLALQQDPLHVSRDLERKGRPEAYVEKVEHLIEEGRAEAL